MNQKQYPEILLVRFTKAQRAFIRKISRLNKVSDAEVVRNAIDLVILEKGHTKFYPHGISIKI